MAQIAILCWESKMPACVFGNSLKKELCSSEKNVFMVRKTLEQINEV